MEVDPPKDDKPKDFKKKQIRKRKAEKEEKGIIGKRNRYAQADQKLLQTRSSPKALKKAIDSLNEAQKRVVEEMGFGSILDLGIYELPSALAYYVVEHFDQETCSLVTISGRIPITEKVIHDMLGIPMGGKSITTVEKARKSNKVVAKFRKQFGKLTGVFRPQEVLKKITTMTSAGFLFKLNFLVLFATTMIDMGGMGTVNQWFLPCITEDTEIKSLDWCGYTLDVLKKSKVNWDGTSEKSCYIGPLTLLVLAYVDHVKCQQMEVIRQRPAIKGWTTKTLRAREDVEVLNGGFGRGSIAPPYGKQDRDDKEVKELIESLKLRVTEFEHQKYVIEKDFIRAFTIDPRPDHSGLIIIHNEWLKLFEEEKDIGVEKVCKTQSKEGSRPDEVGNVVQEGEKVNKEGQPNEQTPIKAEEQRFECRLHFTPDVYTQILESPTFHKQMDDTVRKCLENAFKTNPDETPTFDLGVSQLQSQQDVLPDETPTFDLGVSQLQSHETCLVLYPEPIQSIHSQDHNEPKRKRLQKIGASYKSPFHTRTVNLQKKMTTLETQVANWLFSFQGHPWVQVFQTVTGMSCFKAHMFSLTPELDLCSSVINCFACLLNHDEKYKSNSSPRRVFMPCTTLAQVLNHAGETDEVCFTFFKEDIQEVAWGNEDIMKFKDVSLVFYPVIHASHFYIVCFNLKNPAVDVIDNMDTDVDFQEKYCGVPEALQQMFVRYLKSVKHHRRYTMAKVTPTRLKMKWRTNKMKPMKSVSLSSWKTYKRSLGVMKTL